MFIVRSQNYFEVIKDGVYTIALASRLSESRSASPDDKYIAKVNSARRHCFKYKPGMLFKRRRHFALYLIGGNMNISNLPQWEEYIFSFYAFIITAMYYATFRQYLAGVFLVCAFVSCSFLFIVESRIIQYLIK